MNGAETEIAAFLAAAAGETWLMEPTRLEAWLAQLTAAAQLGASAAGGVDARPLFEPPAAAEVPLPFELRDGVAHVRVAGTMIRGSIPWWMRGAVSTSRLLEHVQLAAEDKRVRSILLRIESPGGSASGIGELADAVYAARQQKPVHAHIDTIGASAAYWVASQASRVTAEPTAEIGSIGAYRPITDSSAAASRYGLKVHLLKSGPFKGAGFPGTPVTEPQLEQAQGVINDLAALFVDGVARGRGLSRDVAAESADGATWLAGDALRRGLIDGIEHSASAHKAIAQLSGGPLPTRNSPAPTPAKGPRMETNTQAPAPAATEAPTAAPVAAASALPPTTPPAAAAAAPSAEAEAIARAERAEAALAAHQASLASLHKQRKADAIQHAIDLGRVAPADRHLWDAYADKCASTDAGVAELSTRLAALPRVTRPTQVGQNTPEPSASAPAFSDAERNAIRSHGIDPDRVAKTSQIAGFVSYGSGEVDAATGVRAGTRVKLRDGSVVVLAEYLAKKEGPR